MNRCYSFFLAACILVASAVAQAQTDPFVIGVNGFSPEFHPMLHRTLCPGCARFPDTRRTSVLPFAHAIHACPRTRCEHDR